MKTPDFIVKYRSLIAFVVGMILALVGVFTQYNMNHTPTIDIGSPGDSPFLSGFYADEPDIDFRYRWTKTHAEVTFIGAGSALPDSVFIRAQGPRGDAVTQPITASLKLNGVLLKLLKLTAPQTTVITLTGELEKYEFFLPDQTNAQDIVPPYVVTIDTSAFNAPGDSRTLGIKLDEIGLTQFQPTGGRTANIPPFDEILWWLALVAGIFGVTAPWRPGIIVTAMIALATSPIAGVLTLDSMLPFVLLPYAAVLVGLAGLLIWRRHDVARLVRKWRKQRERLIEYLDSERDNDTVSRAKWAMLAAMLLFAGLALWTIPQVSWIGHADYAENANVARSLVQGHGLRVDYAAQFYEARPELAHPAETWPLLQPMLIAPFFALLGAQTWVAKLPNLFILLALVWAVFSVGSRLWDARVGLIAGLLTLLHSYFFNSVLYPINDLAFTAIFFWLAWMVWLTFDKEEQLTPRRVWQYAAVGVLAGLLVWSKPSGAVLLVGLGAWWLWGWGRSRVDAKTIEDKGKAWQVPWRGLVWAGGAFVVVLLPLIVRNLLAFHTPFHSTESYDAWILRYYPFYEWENIYKYYIGSELPHVRWIVGGKFGYSNLFDAIGLNIQWVWTKGVMGGVRSSEFVIGPLALVGAIVGGVAAPKGALRVSMMALFSIALYGMFVLLYWHFEGRYFQVAIPWLYLLLAGAIIAAGDLARKVIKGVGGQVVGAVIIAGLTAAFAWSHVEEIGRFLTFDTRPTSFTVAMDWLKANSTPDDVVMTRDPWELNWYTERRAVMIPFDDLVTIRKVMLDSGTTMLQLGGPTDGLDVATCPDTGDGSRFPTGSRPALGKLYCGFEMPGFSLAYKNGDLTIYRLDR